MIRSLLPFLLLLISATAALSQQSPDTERVLGDWNGTISARGMKLASVFHISKGEDGSLEATMDVPAQGAKGIPIQSVRVTQDSLFLNVQAIGGRYAGELVGQSTIDGQWRQGGQEFPLVLEKGGAEEIKRPQDPKKPYPYREEEVKVENTEAGITLAGTLTLPKEKGPHPAVVLFTGSGPQDRDEALMGHRPFLVLADHLTRQGFAVLRLDDRGVGESSGEFENATTEDFVSDAKAAYRELKKHAEVDAKQVGVLGHSEGALVAAELAAQNKDVAFVVLLAGNAVPGTELMVAQNEALLKAAGVPDEHLQKYMNLRKAQFEVAATTKDAEKAEQEIRKIQQEAKSEFTAQEQQQLGLTEKGLEQVVDLLSSPWMRQFLAYDPAPTLQKLEMPVLAIYGSRDLQVPASQNVPAAKKALNAESNKKHTVKELDNLNHLFQTTETGNPSEYGAIEETLAPVALETISDWMKKQVK